MDVCHVYGYDCKARIGAREYAKENCETIKRVMFNNSILRIWTEDGNVHHFMSEFRYSEWCKGRTYALPDGSILHSGYKI